MYIIVMQNNFYCKGAVPGDDVRNVERRMRVCTRARGAAQGAELQDSTVDVMARLCIKSLDLNKRGGYDYDFIDEVPERLTCQICFKPFRDPHLVVCCGKHYCGSCLTTSFRILSVKNCPHCRAEGDKFKYVDHKGLKSEISELKIYCPKRDKGCKWVGQLGHLDVHRTSRDGCDYEEIPCPNKCKDTVVSNGIVVPLISNKHVYRKDLSRHLNAECSNRSYYCEYCHIRDTYEVIVEFHYKVCPEHPVPCPNVRCHIRNIKRKQLDNHLRECSEQLVDCPFAEAGCDKKNSPLPIRGSHGFSSPETPLYADGSLQGCEEKT